MPPEYKQAFLEAFSAFPDYKFLWKYEKPDHQVAKNYSNVIDMPWFPQPDLLSSYFFLDHFKSKLFRASEIEIVH